MKSFAGRGQTNLLVYDGECPLCRRYVTKLRLQESVGPVELVSARDPHPVVHQLMQAGYNLDEGIVFINGDKVYSGDEGMTRLALLPTRVGAFNRLSAAIFRSSRISAIVYPVFRVGRLLLLRIIGRERLPRNTSNPS